MLFITRVCQKLDQNLLGPHVAARQQCNRWIYAARAPDDVSSEPTGRRRCCRSTGQTDGQTDTRPFDDAYRILRGPRNKTMPTYVLGMLKWVNSH